MHSQMVAMTKNDIGWTIYPSIAGNIQRRESKNDDQVIDVALSGLKWEGEPEGSWTGLSGPHRWTGMHRKSWDQAHAILS